MVSNRFKTAQLLSVCLAFSVGIYANQAHAQVSGSPFVATIIESADFAPAVAASYDAHSGVTTIEQISTIALTAQVKTLGNVSFFLNREWRVPDVSYADNGFALQKLDKNGVHLQGEAQLRLSADGSAKAKTRVPVAATIFGAPHQTQRLEAVFYAGTIGSKGNYYKVTAQLVNSRAVGEARVVRISESAFEGRTCGVLSSVTPSQHSSHFTAALTAPITLPATFQSFDISTEADYEYFLAHGSSANTQIQSILNQVQTIYQNQLNLTFSLIRQVVITTNGARYTSYNVETLLDSFRTYAETNRHLGVADVFHLFTGKDTFFNDEGSQNYSVIGLAYVGVICAFPEYAYGLSENFNVALNHITTAHEIGHNFNAVHDSAGSIMGTVLNLSSPPTQFSTTSKSQIGSFVSANSSCLSNTDGSATPTPTPTSGGGGGSDPGQGDTSQVSVSISLSRGGGFGANISLTTIESGCTVTLMGSSNSGRVYTGRELASFSGDFALSQYSNIAVKRATRANKKGRNKVFIGARKTCGSINYYSAIKGKSPKRIRSRRKAISTNSWIRLLARQLQSVTPEQS